MRLISETRRSPWASRYPVNALDTATIITGVTVLSCDFATSLIAARSRPETHATFFSRWTLPLHDRSAERGSNSSRNTDR